MSDRSSSRTEDWIVSADRPETRGRVPEGSSVRVVAVCVGLAGFVVSLLAGAAAENPLDVILTRALVSMVACTLIGAVVGAMGERAVKAHVEARGRSAAGAEPSGAPASAAVSTGAVTSGGGR